MTPRTRNAGIDENGVRSCVDGIKFKAGRRIILEVGTIWSTGCGRSTQIIRRAAAIEKHKIVGRRSVRKTRRDSASSTIANKDIAHISNMILVRCMDGRPLYWCAVNFYRYRLRAVVICRVNIVADSTEWRIGPAHQDFEGIRESDTTFHLLSRIRNWQHLHCPSIDRHSTRSIHCNMATCSRH